jgi:hypothetical protein
MGAKAGAAANGERSCAMRNETSDGCDLTFPYAGLWQVAIAPRRRVRGAWSRITGL